MKLLNTLIIKYSLLKDLNTAITQQLNNIKNADEKTIKYFFIFVLICILFGAGYFFKDKIKSFF